VRRALTLAAARVALIAFVFVAWEAVTGGFGLRPLVDPIVLGRPSLVFADLYEYARGGLLLTDSVATLEAALAGLVLGMLGGVGLGLAFGYWRTVADVFDPIIAGLNSLPRVAMAPVLILWFGLGIASKIVVSFSLVFFIIFYNTYLGVRSVDAELVKAVRVMGGGRLAVARFVLLPSVFSWIFAALRTSVSFALAGAVVGEFVGSTTGLGYRMVIATGLLQTTRVYAILLLLMIIAVSLIAIAKRVEERLLRWRPGGPLE
jgi:NitT/TauT family transport system permease protein